MSEDRITVEELRYISVFNEITGATAFRCIVDSETGKFLFLVKKGDLGKAIGKNGRNIKILGDLLKKPLEVFEYSEDIAGMVRNLLPGVDVLKVDVSERGEEKIVVVKVREEDKGKAIGKDGRNVKRARLVLNRMFGVTKVVIK
ncbi:MAG: NusA-like transcription termination signal-binding factor [Acidilobaceae archaeon]